MKATPRDYLTITAALLAILLCGYGIGFLVGEVTTQRRLAAEAAENASQQQEWERQTLARLRAELGLDDDQAAAVQRELRRAATEIGQVRARALDDYRQLLVTLHDRLLPMLTDEQQARLEKSRAALQELLDKRSEGATPDAGREETRDPLEFHTGRRAARRGGHPSRDHHDAQRPAGGRRDR